MYKKPYKKAETKPFTHMKITKFMPS